MFRETCKSSLYTELCGLFIQCNKNWEPEKSEYT